ncbi:hypothetical protein [Swingsia samuiensis]|uniref:Uncharacterized protein n=1 Tax=Swingsia samuiensis TaxID=1293412 RepID=A0A4Y6UMJ9_9PROT|nr:hypothetical protein [Swingsia samuiensis]QDH17611.1 hypothetical protein E3D00_08585 [Swingsia samuiensis]
MHNFSSYSRLKPLFLIKLLFLSGLLFFRSPSTLLHAQFWGEDGWVWFPDAYHLKIHSLIMAHTGYFQTVSRLIALIGQAFPLRWNPTFYAACAFIFQLLPAAFITSTRCKNLIPNDSLRFFLACLLCTLPNTNEVYVNLTNSQWHLAILAFLIIFSSPPENLFEKTFDYSFLTLSSLSGPFCLLLLPLAIIHTYFQKNKTNIQRLIILISSTFIQLIPLITTSHTTRIHTVLGARIGTLLQLLTSQLFLSPIIGHNHINRLYQSFFWKGPLFPLFVTILCLYICLRMAKKSSFVRYLLLFATLVLTASLMNPIVSTTTPQWNALLIPDTGMRYFFIPLFAWSTTLTIAAFSGPFFVRAISFGLLLIGLFIGIPTDYSIPTEPDRNFQSAADAFDKAPIGTTITIPVRPNSSQKITK